jgi:hypothetical protein
LSPAGGDEKEPPIGGANGRPAASGGRQSLPVSERRAPNPCFPTIYSMLYDENAFYLTVEGFLVLCSGRLLVDTAGTPEKICLFM